MVASIHLRVPCPSFHPAGLAPWLVSFIPFSWFLAPSLVFHILPCVSPASWSPFNSLPGSPISACACFPLRLCVSLRFSLRNQRSHGLSPSTHSDPVQYLGGCKEEPFWS